MRIAIVAGPWLSVPPKGYGGTEFVISKLVDGLVDRGHDVLLLAPGDSITKARLIPLVKRHIGQDWQEYGQPLSSALSEYAFVRSYLEQADIIHDHTMYHNTWLPMKVVYTLHGPAERGMAELARRMSAFGQNNYFVAISNRQRQLFGEDGINFVSTVHNCIDVDAIPYSDQKGDYLFFVGRVNWEKGLDLAIRIAVVSKRKLVMAIKMTEAHEQEYFRETIKPLLPGADIEILEDISNEEKFNLFKHAYATLFTSQWEEPFGLVITESLAAGTPVIALRRGAAPEIIKGGVCGFLGDSFDDLVEALNHVPEIRPHACRRHVVEHFSIEKMVAGYEAAYRAVLYGS
ncbi:MAG TPA: glycosyltransferase family 4 protein [Candidatus Aquicultor sp.]|jgi:glycosyltransferase involved in cell wall biosynthesis